VTQVIVNRGVAAARGFDNFMADCDMRTLLWKPHD